MALDAIGDLHLCLGAAKPMDIFGGNWIGYMEKLKESIQNSSMSSERKELINSLIEKIKEYGFKAENIAIFVTNIEIMKIFSFEKKISICGKMSLIYISCNSFGMWI